MRFSTFFFDLDETLYPPSTGLWEEIGGRINQFMGERMGFPADQILEVRQKYFREYGTTLRGLQVNHKVDMEEYLAFVHDVPLDRYIHPDPTLRVVIESIRARKFIFTNADTNHANRVLNALGLWGIFDGIIDVHVIAPYCKPMTEAFGLALRAAAEPDADACLLFDDQARVTRAAHTQGFFSVLVNQSAPSADADATLKRLADLPSILERQ